MRGVVRRERDSIRPNAYMPPADTPTVCNIALCAAVPRNRKERQRLNFASVGANDGVRGELTSAFDLLFAGENCSPVALTKLQLQGDGRSLVTDWLKSLGLDVAKTV